MHLSRLCRGCVSFAIAALVSAISLPADSISNNSGEDSLAAASSAAGRVDDPPADYSFFRDGPDFGDLGLIPGAFLFGGNTSWNFTGSQEISIISAITDPGQSILRLDDPGTIAVTLTLPDNANGHGYAYGLGHALDGAQAEVNAVTAVTPEPTPGLLFLCSGLVLISLYAASRVRRIKSDVEQAI
jgi:hypothetical protein